MMKRDSSSNNLKKQRETISEQFKISKFKIMKLSKKERRSELKKLELS